MSDGSDPSDAGAKWTVDNTNWYDSGDTIYMVSGDYTVSFVCDSCGSVSDESVIITDRGTQSIAITMEVIENLNYAMEFNGSNDYIDYDVEDWQGSFTIETWIQINEDQQKAVSIFSSSDSTSTASSFQIDFANTNTIQMHLTDDFSSNKTVSIGDIEKDEWYHIAVSFDNSNRYIKTFLNGLEQNSQRLKFKGVFDVYKIAINRNNKKYFSGQLDEFRIWNTARTWAEIQENMGSTLTGSEDGLVAYYQFDEGSGSTLTDSSLSGHDGTIHNSPQWIDSQAMSVGSLTVNIKITGDVDPVEVGASWSVDKTNWYNSGDTAYLVEGDYVVTFRPVRGYYSSSDEYVSIVDGASESITSTYSVAQGGTMLMMTLLPKDIDKEGAMWSLSNGEWSDESVVFDMSNGDYIIDFKPIHGWNTPESQEIRLSGGTSTITAEYLPPNLTNLIQTLQALCDIWQLQKTEFLDMNANDNVDLIDAMQIIHSMASQ